MTEKERLALFPKPAREILSQVAKRSEINVFELIEDYPHTMAVMIARREAFERLSHHLSETGKRAWTTSEIAKWFGISRQALWRARSVRSGFVEIRPGRR